MPCTADEDDGVNCERNGSAVGDLIRCSPSTTKRHKLMNCFDREYFLLFFFLLVAIFALLLTEGLTRSVDQESNKLHPDSEH